MASISSRAQERRSRPRVQIAVEVSLTSDSQFYTGLTGDLSEGGVFIATYHHLPVGSAIDVTLALPDGEVHARGSVRWKREPADGVVPGLGVAFDELPAATREAIEAFCRERDPIYYEVDDAAS